MDTTVDADLHFAGSSMSSGNAQVDAGGLAYAVGDAEGSVSLEAHDHSEHQHEDGDEDEAADEAGQHQQPLAVDDGCEADAAPAEAEEEVDEVAQREQREDAG